jgi:hypothetical protein
VDKSPGCVDELLDGLARFVLDECGAQLWDYVEILGKKCFISSSGCLKCQARVWKCSAEI